MKRLAAFFALPAGDRFLLVRAFVTVGLFRLALTCLPLERLRRIATRRGSGRQPVNRIVWAVRAASRHVPGTSCLCSALALQRLLSHHGQSAELHVGVARLDGVFAAHAWVTQDNEMLLGESDADYALLATWQMSEHQAGKTTNG